MLSEMGKQCWHSPACNCQFQVIPLLPACNFPPFALWVACRSMKHNRHHLLAPGHSLRFTESFSTWPTKAAKLLLLLRQAQCPWFTDSQAPGIQCLLPPFLLNATYSCGKILALCLPRCSENPDFNDSSHLCKHLSQQLSLSSDFMIISVLDPSSFPSIALPFSRPSLPSIDPKGPSVLWIASGPTMSSLYLCYTPN